MVQNGLKPIQPDKRDYSFPRTFGAIAPTVFPDEYDCDYGLTMPNQLADGYPYGCTGYTQAELCTDEDGIIYKPSYTYDKTRWMEGTEGQNVGCEIRTSLKSTIAFGVQALNETTDGEAMQHRRAQYFNVSDVTYMDDFDDIRNALLSNKNDMRAVSIGTPWFPEWSTSDENGIVPDFVYDGNPHNYNWHNWKVSGWKQINGQPYLTGKTWQGKDVGVNGLLYFSRATINKVMAIRESAAFTLAQSHPNDVQTIRNSTIATILETAVIFLRRMIAIIARA